MDKKHTHTTRVMNCCKQLISIQVKPPGGDFYLHEQQVRILPGQTVLLPKDHLRDEQIKNLQSRGMLKVIYDSELIEDQQAESTIS